jgi:hypothetical protein
MKYLYMVIVSVVLLDSCSVTQRRYMPGYSVTWNHKAPKTVLYSESNFVRNAINHHPPPTTIAIKEFSLPSLKIADDETTPAHLNPLTLLHYKNKTTKHFVSIAKEPLPSSTSLKTDLPAKASPDNYYVKEICKQSRTSMVTGMFSLTILLFSVVIGLLMIALKSSGGLWASLNLAGPVFFMGCLIGGVLGVTAIVSGIIAIHKINKGEEKYTGKTNAVTGMVFATIFFGILTLMAIVSMVNAPATK